VIVSLKRELSWVLNALVDGAVQVSEMGGAGTEDSSKTTVTSWASVVDSA
jgi:hypothetical protein